MTTNPDVAVRIDGATAVVCPSGEVDLAVAPALAGVLDRLISQGDVRAIVVDLGLVTFLDSSGLAVLVDAWRAANAAGISLGLAPNVAPRVAQVLRITGVDALLEGS
jgi:anti-sigma B factor antagonist